MEEPSMKRWGALSVCVVIILFACKKQEKQPALAEGEILFNVDSTLVQPAFSASGFGFKVSAPLSWQANSADRLNEIRQSLDSFVEVKDDFQILPLQFYLNPENQCLLVVSYVAGTDSGMAPSAFRDSYLLSVRITFALNNLQESRYIRNGIPVIQYLLQKDGNIIFKTLFHDSMNRLIQLDYVVPQSVYAQEAKAIESSIGTISIR
jgi:hypothetical protein